MSAKIEWGKLRAWNGDQRLAFEALCRQLAEAEQFPPGSKFTPKGSPDGGIECFWTLPNGDEWGWQAKFFTEPPGDIQWRQLDDSVERALKKHPRLVGVTISFPIDRPDPRVERQKSFMDRWNEHEAKWHALAANQQRSIQYRYWGEHEILERLSREEHRGRYLFWFNEPLFSDLWFCDRLEEAIANAGPRYSPELNVELPVARLFDGLGNTPRLYDELWACCRQIKQALPRASSKDATNVAGDQYDALNDVVNLLLHDVACIQPADRLPIDWCHLADLASKAIGWADDCRQTLLSAASQHGDEAPIATLGPRASATPTKFDPERYYLSKLIMALDSLRESVESSTAQLRNVRALLLVGAAGMGKTHLFCDVASQRLSSCLPTVLLFGAHFRNDEPWSQITRLLNLSCDKEQFLGALDAAAQARNARSLILIDALNEGDGRDLWQKHLSGMLEALARYPRVAIGVSVRESYEDSVVAEGLVPGRLVRNVHYGFADQEYEAGKAFFEHYGIELPSVPLLWPEFQNPQFLLTLCKGLKNNGLTRIPTGLHGITAVFDFFSDSVNRTLSRPERLDFDPKSNLVRTATQRLCEQMAETGSRFLPRHTAASVVDALLPGRDYERSLFRHMVSEGILAEDRWPIAINGEQPDVVHFSYEKLADHLIARHLLENHFDAANPARSFGRDARLGIVFTDEYTAAANSGLVEALSVQIPDRLGKELIDVAPHCAQWRPVLEAFLNSLVWRTPQSITESTIRYINEHVLPYEHTLDPFLAAMLMLAPIPDHPLNAERLHENLMRPGLPQRDAWWSTSLHRQYHYGEHSPIHRLIDWAWSPADKSHVEDNVVELCGIALIWCLTASNRYLRDRATKALVQLLSNRIGVLGKLIARFSQVDDPYVLERLFAVAYGCAMRTSDHTAIGDLANDIYRLLFQNGNPPVDILTRDYARGVIELALYRGVKLPIDVGKIRPPYGSAWLLRTPTDEDLDHLDGDSKGASAADSSRRHLRFSIMNWDFGEYIIGGMYNWSPRRLDEPAKISQADEYGHFVASLTNRQKNGFERCLDARRLRDQQRWLSIVEDAATTQIPDQELARIVDALERRFRRTLGKGKLRVFEATVIPYLNNPRGDIERFDSSMAKRWILNRVYELGWSAERFAHFDDAVQAADRGREARKPERIGKKYQWIAYHEFLTRVADNFQFSEYWDERPAKYEGPWQLHRRDIDPSFLLTKTRSPIWRPDPISWWFPCAYDSWDAHSSDFAWLQQSGDLPDPRPLIDVAMPTGNSGWLALRGFYTWEQPTPPMEERFDYPRRHMWYILNGYIVRKPDADAVFDWAAEQNFSGRWMPESSDVHDVFFGELFWSPAHKYHHAPSHGFEEWTRGDNDRVPHPIKVTSEQYYWEAKGYDCSVEETILVHVPAVWLAEHMGLRWSGVEGRFSDNRGNLVAFDPSVETEGPGVLLISRDALLEFLDTAGYDIIWTILGEKNIVGGAMRSDDRIGRLDVSGAYRMVKGQLQGKLTTRFVSFRDS